MTKMRNAAFALVSALVLAMPSIGMAQGMSGPDSAWYIGGSYGQSKFAIDCTGAACEDTDSSFRIFGGYTFNKHFGVELGYADLGAARITGVLPPFGTITADLGAKAWDLVAVGVLPIADKFSLYGKLGMYQADVDLSASSTGGGSGSASDSNTDITYAIGAGYDFNKNFGIRADWQRYQKVGSDNTGGDGDIDVISIGVVYRFK